MERVLMDFWAPIKRLFRACPISLRDLYARPAPSFPSLPHNRIRKGKGKFLRSNTLPLVVLNGTHRELGQQEGQLLRPQINAFIRHYLTSSIGRSRKKWHQLRTRAKSCKQYIPERYLDEFDGLGEQTGLGAELLISVSVFLDFYSDVLCSNIAISSEGTRSNRLTVGRNLDFPSMGAAHRMTLFKCINPDGYYRHVHLTWPGLNGVLTGMNEHGLTLALSEVDGAESFDTGMPYTLMHRRILEECKTIDQAEEIVRSVSRTRSNNLLVADQTGRAAVIEYDRKRVERRGPEDNWVYATNHFVSETLPNQPISLKYFSAVRRYQKIRQVHQSGEILSDKTLLELLRHLALGRLNLASMLMYPGERTMQVRIGAPPAANRKRIPLDLNSFFKNGETAGDGS